MSRLIDSDFLRLEQFIKEYELGSLLHSKVRTQLIKRAHKHCLASVQVLAMIDRFSDDGNIVIIDKNLLDDSLELETLRESFSDTTSSFFAALHGIFKPAHMSLRSAIETYVRAITSTFVNEAATTTSVYRLFELAKECEAFRNFGKQYLDTLINQYSDLCAFTHTATRAHMVKNHAMSSFPRNEVEKLRAWLLAYEKVTIAIICSLIFVNRRIYLAGPLASKDLFDEVLPKEIKIYALGG